MKLKQSLAIAPYTTTNIDWRDLIAANPVPNPDQMLPNASAAMGFTEPRYIGGILVTEFVVYERKLDLDTLKVLVRLRQEQERDQGIIRSHDEVHAEVFVERNAKTLPTRSELPILVEVSDATSVFFLGSGRTVTRFEDWWYVNAPRNAIDEKERPRIISAYAAIREKYAGQTITPVLFAWRNVPQGESKMVGGISLEIVGNLKVQGPDVKATLVGADALTTADLLQDPLQTTPVDLWLRCGATDYHLTPNGIDKMKIRMAPREWKTLDVEDKIEVVLDDAWGACEIVEAIYAAASAQE